MLTFLRPKSAFSNVVRAKRCCVHAYFRINGVSKRRFKTPKNVRLQSWLEQNTDSGGSINAKSHITMFKWRHINAFPVHLTSNNSLNSKLREIARPIWHATFGKRSERMRSACSRNRLLLEGSINSTRVNGVLDQRIESAFQNADFCLRKI